MTAPLPPSLEGTLLAPEGARFALCAARFNEAVVEKLLSGAKSGLLRLGVPAEAIFVTRVPGAWELPLVCKRLAQSGRFEAVLALGAVIRGATSHFDYVAGQTASGLAAASLESGVPIIFGVLTTDTMEQAEERAGGKAGNKGFDAALSAVELVNLARRLSEHAL